MTPTRTTEEVLAERQEQGHDVTQADLGAGSAAAKPKPKWLVLLAAMGPGIVTAMAGNDAGGIAAYSTLGADFGFAGLGILPIMCILLAVVQLTAGKMGAVTGKGFAGYLEAMDILMENQK